MELQVLISTMNQNDFSLVEKMNIQTEAVIVNQCNHNSIEKVIYNDHHITWVNIRDSGLSRSRNLTLKHATADICILADDDLVYIDGYKDLIIEQFKLHKNADIIVFQVEGIERHYKNYYHKMRKLNYLTVMKVSSVEIAFRTEKIKDKLKFNELFGSGAKYCMGEESIFLYDCIKHGLNILYVPIKIADLHLGNSTWFTGYNKNYFISKGAQFTAMSNIFSIPYIIQYAIRKHKIYKNQTHIFKATKYMLEGRKEYLNDDKYKMGSESN